MGTVCPEFLEHWLFWRIVFFGSNENFMSVSKLTFEDMLEYSYAISLKDAMEYVAIDKNK